MATDRILRYVYYGAIAILAIVSLVMIFKGTDEDPKVDMSLWQGIIYTGIAAGATLIFALIGLVLNFKSNIKALIFVAVLIGAYFVFKGMASSDVPQRMLDEGITPFVLSTSESGVMVSFFLMFVAIGITVVSGVRGLFE